MTRSTRSTRATGRKAASASSGRSADGRSADLFSQTRKDGPPAPSLDPPAATDDWTRGADGKAVDWTKAPYRVGGKVRLVLAGEKTPLPDAVRDQRIREYTKLCRREIRAACRP